MEDHRKQTKDRSTKKRKTSANSQDSKKIGTDSTSTKKNKKNKKIGWKIFRVCLFVGIALCIVGAGLAFGIVSGIIDKTDSVDLNEIRLLSLTSFVYDKDGNEIASFHGTENRVKVDYKDIPKYVVDAVTSIEDERFFSHKGVDVKRTLHAIVTYILNGGKSDFGGSTITQQLVKNVTDDDEGSVQRKIREWYRAYSLEKELSKEDIFESYVNTIYMGDGAHGIEVAANNYFGKSVKDVNIAEGAVLAAVIQSPESTNPYRSEEAKAKLLDRQKVVLSQMLKLGKITQEEYDEALKTEIVFKRGEKENPSKIQTYFAEAVFDAVVKDLMEQKNVDKSLAEQMVYNNGYKIYTTMDSTVQKAIDDAYANPKLFYTDRSGDFMQSSMVVINQSNGHVVGLIGGAGEKTANRILNRATSQPRQPGSCMKPLGAYGPAFEQGVLSPGSGLDDSYINQAGWTPKNYYNYFNGYVTVRDAISKSMNIPAILANQRVNADFAFNFAKNLGLTRLDAKNDKNASALGIGGLTNGATAMDMATAYATIANGGYYMEPLLYTKVLDNDDKEVLVKTNSPKRVMKDSTAYMLTSCLQTVVTSGTAAGSVRVGKMPVAGKTGNTDGDVDQWFCGYTPHYTIACWNGYDEVGGKPGTKAINRPYPYFSMRLFNTVMNVINQGKEVKQFEQPDTIINASVCRDSGLVATDACRTDPRGDRTITDLFAKGTVPTATCNVHKTAKVCTETNKLATEYCPSTAMKSFITREGDEPPVKPSDWGYMLPKDTCDVHTSPVKPEKPDDGDVDIYTDKKQ